MKLHRVCAAIAAAVCIGAASVAAQATVTATAYGNPGLYQTPIDPALFLQADVSAPQMTRLELVGGFKGDPAAMLVSTEPAAIPLGIGAMIYVGEPAVPIWGVFGPDGTWEVRFNPNLPALIGADLYFQGVEALSVGGLQLSNGMHVNIAG